MRRRNCFPSRTIIKKIRMCRENRKKSLPVRTPAHARATTMSAFVAAYTFSYDWYVQFQYHAREWVECNDATCTARHAVFRHLYADHLFLAGETIDNDTVWRLSLDSVDELSSLLPIAAIVRVQRRAASTWEAGD